MYLYDKSDGAQTGTRAKLGGCPGNIAVARRTIANAGLGYPPLRTPWRERVMPQPKPQYLKFLTIDHFPFDQPKPLLPPPPPPPFGVAPPTPRLRDALTPQIKARVKQLAEHVRASWKSMQAIGYVRLVGHTDDLGDVPYNVALGNRRASAVKEELEEQLKNEIITGKVKIAIIVDPSPGKSQPVTTNGTSEGKARNRRVEVFVKPPIPPEEKRKIDWTPRDPGPGKNPPPPIPQRPPPKSLRQFVNRWLRDHHIPKWLGDKIWDLVFGKDFSALSSLLNTASISGAEKDAFLETVRALTEGKVQ